MTAGLRRRTGFEVELLAPRGASRRTLADAFAARCGGTVYPVWHQDSEPALVPHLGGRFLHLTQGFEVRRLSGEQLCTLVDDVTIVADLDPRAPAPPGWHRLLTDDARLVALLARHSDPGGSVAAALDGVATLWGSTAEQIGNIWRLDGGGGTIALATPSGGERERPCEVVTPPLSADHEVALDELLGPARELGFTVPSEAAVHIHVDGEPFREPTALANIVRLFALWRDPLRHVLGTNPRCRRLAPLPASLVEAAASMPTTSGLREAAQAGGLSKFFDVNLTQVLRDDPVRDTVEIRILPGSIDAADIVRRAAVVESLLDRCTDPMPFPGPPVDPAAAPDALRRLASPR